MARVKGPLMSAGASGSLASGLVQFRMTRHGPQAIVPAHGRATRPNRPTSEQRLCRNDLRAVAEVWRGLDPAIRTAWNAAARPLPVANGWSLYLASALPELRSDAQTLLTVDGRAIISASGFRLTI